MANARSVWIVVLNWNGLSDTLACVQSLQQLHYPERRIVVVDNGSTDGSIDALRGARSSTGFELIETERNLGYAGGNNVGIRHALDNGAEFILVLNNDAVVDPFAFGRAGRVGGTASRSRLLRAVDLLYARPRATLVHSFRLVVRVGCLHRAGKGPARFRTVE